MVSATLVPAPAAGSQCTVRTRQLSCEYFRREVGLDLMPAVEVIERIVPPVFD